MGKILAVDDEEEMLELVKMALERDGHPHNSKTIALIILLSIDAI